MACTIDATAGGAASNSYETIAGSSAYHDTHLYSSDWDNADADQQCRALQMATRLLDQWFDWIGFVSTSTQALLWPRSGVVGPDGYLEDSTAIPTRIKQATAELARQLIAENITANSDVETQGIKKIKAGSVELEFTGSASSKPIPDSVLAMVGFYGRSRGSSGGAVQMLRA